ncbi:mitochondrial escape protein 2 [Xylographa vitiligo]|nr:mitochondrial escape protein 2 [Xylographa vitiligo]
MLSRTIVGRPGGVSCQILPFRQYHLKPCDLRPRGGPPKTCKGVRRKTTEAGDDKSGHINAGPNEGIIFLDNVFPLKLRWLLHLPFVNVDKSVPELLKRLNSPRIGAADPMSIIQKAIPKDLPIKVTEVLPRLKEGGAFVKFSHESHIETKEIEGTLKTYLKENPIKPWFNPWRRVRTFLVKGRPWVEDLYRFPSSRLRVEFLPLEPGGEAAELSQETLYSIFRRYGKLADIMPQPVDSKVTPKFAFLNFRLVRHAIMAKNCMHGFVVPGSEGGGKAGTVIKLIYEQKMKAHWIREWIVNHPRITIPLIAAVLATVTAAAFDPIRTFFIKAHVTHSFHITDNKYYKWLMSQVTRANDLLSFKRQKADDAGLSVIWDERKDDIEQIQAWLMESADTFVVIQGPRGSGKKELVIDQALKDRRNTLVVDCKPIQEARGDSATIGATANQVGYKPVFSFINNISSLVDLAAQGTIGTKTGFSETLDTQLDKIFQNTAIALKQIALEDRKKDDKDADIGDDEYLEAHPERRPVVVIDNFLHKSSESGTVYDKISQWAAGLTTGNVAHVIFLTNDVSFTKSLSKALPDRVFRQITLGDCSPAVAKRFVLNHLDADASEPDPDAPTAPTALPPSRRRADLAELDGCIETLGGRLTELEFLARRIKAGQTPAAAVCEIIDQSASEILKLYLLDLDHGGGSSSGSSSSPRGWTAPQAWELVKALAPTGSARYHEVLLSDTFQASGGGGGGGEAALQALEQAELIAVVSANGRPHSLRPGKPVYQAAFRQLLADAVLAARLDLAILAELTAVETRRIERCEAELSLLAGLGRPSAELAARVRWLLGRVRAGQGRVEGWEEEGGRLKRVLRSED